MFYYSLKIHHVMNFIFLASPNQIQKFYDEYVERLEPIRKPEFIIEECNWSSYIGNEA